MTTLIWHQSIQVSCLWCHLSDVIQLATILSNPPFPPSSSTKCELFVFLGGGQCKFYAGHKPVVTGVHCHVGCYCLWCIVCLNKWWPTHLPKSLGLSLTDRRAWVDPHRESKQFLGLNRFCTCVIGCVLNLYHPEWAELLLKIVMYYMLPLYIACVVLYCVL